MDEIKVGDQVRYANVLYNGGTISGVGTVLEVTEKAFVVRSYDDEFFVWRDSSCGEHIERVAAGDPALATTTVHVGDRVRFENVMHDGVYVNGEGVVTKRLETMARIQCSEPWLTVEAYLDGTGGEIVERLTDAPAPVAAPAADDYHSKKFDAGKADWSLLPAAAAVEILDAHAAEYAASLEDEDVCESCPDEYHSEACNVANFVFEWLRTRNRRWLARAPVAFDGVGLTKLAGVVTVLEYGAKKYARDSWHQVPDAVSRYSSACLRHLAAMVAGETNDAESGLPHRDHALCNIVFLLELTRGA